MRHIKPVKIAKLIELPLIVVLIIMMFFAFVFTSYIKNNYEENLVENQVVIAQSFANQISLNYEFRDGIIKDIDEVNLSVANYVLSQKDLLSNEFLADIASVRSIDYIAYYSSEGEVIYDSLSEFIGWTASIGDPIYSFMISGLDEFVEDIRNHTDYDYLVKSAYVRDEDGSFIQVVSELSTIESELALFENEVLIENLKDASINLDYILMLNEENTVIVDSEDNRLGVSFDDESYTEAMQGEVVSHKVSVLDYKDLYMETIAPIYYNGEIVGSIVIGMSLSGLNQIISNYSLIFLIIIMILFTLYALFQWYFVLRPLRLLNIHFENNRYNQMIPKIKKNIFEGLFSSVNTFLEIINKDNETIKNEVRKNDFLANHDFLTGLWNRRGLVKLLYDWVDKDKQFLIVYFDLDNFKHYNDLRGHDFGDKILLNLAERLTLIASETMLVSRFGGDEFVIAIDKSVSDNVSSSIASIINLIEEDIYIDGFKCYLLASIGIAEYKVHSFDVVDVISKAEKAMYEAKKSNSSKVYYFTEDLVERNNKNLQLVELLKECVANDGFEMYYQPQVDCKTQEIVAFEALLRIKNNNMSPGIFVPVAEKAGLMNKIGQIVIDKVTEQISVWKDKGFKLYPVFINLSPIQLYDQEIVFSIKKKLDDYGIDPKYFGIEITENLFIDKEKRVLDLLHDFKKLGILIAIDDFGSGQAGVNYLTNFEVDIIKTSKSVADKFLNEKGVIVFSTIIKLCHSLGFKVIAEGIESKEQVEYLLEMGVKVIQGYYYYRPMKLKDIEKDILQ